MALQDLPAYNQGAFIDPTTGLPYPYGSTGYQAAELPFLESQLQAEAERGANARGMFYSGPALADEQQAAALLASNMASQGAQQDIAQKNLAQQEAFAQQQQTDQNQANADIARASAAAQAKAGAISGGLGSLGTLGGMYMMGKMMKPSVPGATAGATPAAGTPLIAQGASAPDFSLASSTGPMPGLGGPGYTAPAATAPSSGLASLPGMAPGAMGPLSLGAGALGAYGANQATDTMLKLLGNKPNGTLTGVGSGLGGLVGQYFGGPLGATVGSGYGALVGNQMTHPVRGLVEDALLGPIGPVLGAIPGVDKFIGNAGRDIGNFFSHLF